MTRLPVTTTNDDSLRRSIGISGGLHFVGLLALYIGLPLFTKPLPTPYVPIPFEIVDIADLTNTRVKEQQEPPKPPEPAPKPQEQKPVAAYQPPQPPQPSVPQPKPQPPDQVKAEAEALIPKPAEKPEPPKPVAKPPPDMLASVLKNVQKLKPAEKVQTPPDAKAQTKSQAQPKSMAPSLSERLTISEEDALRRQIESCWNPPIGARDADKLAVDITIIVNADRTVQRAEVVDKSRANSDPYFRAAAEAAIRAVNNPQCSPLALPEGKYEQWKNISFTFNPRDML